MCGVDESLVGDKKFDLDTPWLDEAGLELGKRC